MDYKDKSVLFYDHGTFVSLAERLAEDFGKVYYFSPYNNSFPTSTATFIGMGLKGVTRVNNFFDYVDKVDLIIFPDVGDGDLQVYLESKGKRVFGSRKGEDMELKRDSMKEYMKSLKLDVGKYSKIKGIENLREYLKIHENQWVKTNIFRGDFETFESKNYNLIEPVLDELEQKLGAKKTEMWFIVEDNLDNTVETGMDLYSVDGEFPEQCIAGIEIKNSSYVAVVKNYKDFPEKLTGFNDAIKPALKTFRFRSFFSTEQRINDKKSYMNDFCARLGSPPSELYQTMYENISDIIWNAADGILVNPIIKHKFGAELLIKSSWADTHWMPLDIPNEIREYVKLRNYCIINNKYYMIPRRGDIHEIGAVVATADTLEKAISLVKERASKLEAYWIEISPESLDKALEESQKLEQYGLKIF